MTTQECISGIFARCQMPSGKTTVVHIEGPYIDGSNGSKALFMVKGIPPPGGAVSPHRPGEVIIWLAGPEHLFPLEKGDVPQLLSGILE